MINKDEMVRRVAFATSTHKKVVEEIVDTLLENITEILSKGEEDVRFTGFGTFKSVERKERWGVHPRNPSEKIFIGKTRVAKFTTGSDLKKAVKG